MEKSKVFIASSERTLTLAESLTDQLEAEFCETTLWSEGGRRNVGKTIIETLEMDADAYDFAVFILAKDDVLVAETGDKHKARDNCVFEAGLFTAALGRERCFLVNSVDQANLPSDLGGVISLQFEEPEDLSDRDASARVAKKVGSVLKNKIQCMGRRQTHARLPLLTVDEVFSRERLRYDQGDLNEGQIVVCDVQPITRAELAMQVYRNIENGINYLYFLHFSEESVDKLLKGLHALAAGCISDGRESKDFDTRYRLVVNNREQAINGLRRICRSSSLIVSFLPSEPTFCFRVHNATDPELARLYLRYHAHGFILWAKGSGAVSLWRDLPRYVAIEDQQQIFVPSTLYRLEGDFKTRFHRALELGLSKYFPGAEEEIRELCVGLKTSI